MSTFDKVKDIIVDSLGCEAELVTMEAHINDDLGADSLAAVELIMALEDAFGISIPEEQAKETKYVKDIIRLIEAGDTAG